MKLPAVFLLVLALAFTGAATVSAQTPNIATVSNGISDFAKTLAPALPAAASTSMTWSDAFIGRLLDVPPHFGIGISTQTTFLPFKAVDSVLSALGQAAPSGISAFTGIGIPFPTYAIEARVGGIILPFDLGVKFGIMPVDPKNFTGSLGVDYLMYGVDLRWALLEDKLVSPALSVGLGYTYLKGGVFVTLADITLATVPTGPGTTSAVALSKPKVGFEWEDKTIDLKVQLSKNLIFMTPYIGLGANLSWVTAGGGFYATPTIGGTAMTASQMDYLKANFPGSPAATAVTADGIVVKYTQNSIFGARVFGGVSFNLAVLRFDLSALYNFTSQSFGANFGVRVQI